MTGVERRAFARAGGDAWGVTGARIRPGHHVSIVDVGDGGVLVVGLLRLVPGALVEIQIETGFGRTMHAGRVVRSAVAELSATEVRYRAAIAFQRSPGERRASVGYVLPGGESIAQGAARVTPTRIGESHGS